LCHSDFTVPGRDMLSGNVVPAEDLRKAGYASCTYAALTEITTRALLASTFVSRVIVCPFELSNELSQSRESRPPICCTVRLYSVLAKLSPVKHASSSPIGIQALALSVPSSRLGRHLQSPFDSRTRMCTRSSGGYVGRIAATLSVGSSSS
jgi:hypothetical protein